MKRKNSKLKFRLKVCSCLWTANRAPLKSTFYLTKLEHQILHEINTVEPPVSDHPKLTGGGRLRELRPYGAKILPH